MNCSVNSGHCHRHRSCKILGHCVFDHPYIKDNPEATKKMHLAIRIKDVLHVLHEHTQRRMIFSGVIIYPGKYVRPEKGKKAKNIERKTENKINRKAVESKTLDPVTQKMYNDRMKRIAETDAQSGYIYHETIRQNFNHE